MTIKEEGTVAELAAALEAEAEARALFFTQESDGGTEPKTEDIKKARHQNQKSLEIALYAAAGNQAAIDAALENYYEANIDAYVEAGVAIESYAKAQEISVKALIKSSANLSSDAQFALTQMAAELRARAIARAVRAQFVLIGASNAQLTAVTNAGASLRAAIRCATTMTQIATAFVNYHNTVIAELQTGANAHASAILTMATAINATGGARLVLQSSI